MPSPWPAGPLTDLFGQALAPASPSPPQEDKAALLTSGISGLGGFGSSPSVALTQSLANRLRERLDSAGSIEFSQTWKRKDTPAGRRYWAHTASARRTSDRDFSGWPSPKTPGPHDDACRSFESALNEAARRGPNNSLDVTAQLAGWPTPGSQDTNRTLEAWEKANAQKTAQGIHLQQCLSITAQLAGWPTPTRQDQIGSGVRDYPATETHHSGTTLTDAARLAPIASWANPRVRDADKGVRTPAAARKEIARKGPQNELGLVVGLVANNWGEPDSHGKTASGSPASTARRGALSPLFSLWLMLGSVSAVCAWASCAPAGKGSRRASECSEAAETPSLPQLPPSSSEP